MTYLFALIFSFGFNFSTSNLSVDKSLGLDQHVPAQDTIPCQVFIPNSFTPDGNEHNSIFKVYTECSFDFFNLKIYNRAGQLVFESKDPNATWNGNFGNQYVKNGTYVYHLNYAREDEEKNDVYGFINVMR